MKINHFLQKRLHIIFFVSSEFHVYKSAELICTSSKEIVFLFSWFALKSGVFTVCSYVLNNDDDMLVLLIMMTFYYDSKY